MLVEECATVIAESIGYAFQTFGIPDIVVTPYIQGFTQSLMLESARYSGRAPSLNSLIFMLSSGASDSVRWLVSAMMPKDQDDMESYRHRHQLHTKTLKKIMNLIVNSTRDDKKKIKTRKLDKWTRIVAEQPDIYHQSIIHEIITQLLLTLDAHKTSKSIKTNIQVTRPSQEAGDDDYVPVLTHVSYPSLHAPEDTVSYALSDTTSEATESVVDDETSVSDRTGSNFVSKRVSKARQKLKNAGTSLKHKLRLKRRRDTDAPAEDDNPEADDVEADDVEAEDVDVAEDVDADVQDDATDVITSPRPGLYDHLAVGVIDSLTPLATAPIVVAEDESSVTSKTSKTSRRFHMPQMSLKQKLGKMRSKISTSLKQLRPRRSETERDKQVVTAFEHSGSVHVTSESLLFSIDNIKVDVPKFVIHNLHDLYIYRDMSEHDDKFVNDVADLIRRYSFFYNIDNYIDVRDAQLIYSSPFNAAAPGYFSVFDEDKVFGSAGSIFTAVPTPANIDLTYACAVPDDHHLGNVVRRFLVAWIDVNPSARLTVTAPSDHADELLYKAEEKYAGRYKTGNIFTFIFN